MKMTVNNWRKYFLSCCCLCKHFKDSGYGRFRYKCGKFGCSIYRAVGCNRLEPFAVEAKKVSDAAVQEAFKALTSPL
jgi:hypothetical protein